MTLREKLLSLRTAFINRTVKFIDIEDELLKLIPSDLELREVWQKHLYAINDIEEGVPDPEVCDITRVGSKHNNDIPNA